jgi:hypothetical protein
MSSKDNATPAPVQRLVGRMFRCTKCNLSDSGVTALTKCRKCGGDLVDYTEIAIKMREIRMGLPVGGWTPMRIVSSLVAWGAPINPPNSLDQ